MKSKSIYFQRFNRTYYTTDGYDDYLQRFPKQGTDYALRLVKRLKPKKSWRFLDVGCGMGGIVSALRKLDYKAWGTEVSSFCLQNSPVKKWMKFDEICNLSFPKNSFEVVLTIDVFCYLNRKETRQAVKELSKITKYFLYIETICKGASNSSQRINPDPLRKDNSLLTRREMVHLLKKEGFHLSGSLFGPEEKGDFNNVFVKK